MKTKEETAIYQREYYQKNKKKIREQSRDYQKKYQKKWRKENKKKYLNGIKSWRKRNPDKVKKTKKKWNEKNKKHIQEYGKKYKQTPKARYSRYKSGARKRNHCFCLTFKQFMSFWQNPCHYCGSEIKTIGIDRKDNSKGYILENCVPCCWRCNEFKRTRNYEYFINMCKKIGKHQEA